MGDRSGDLFSLMHSRPRRRSRGFGDHSSRAVWGWPGDFGPFQTRDDKFKYPIEHYSELVSVLPKDVDSRLRRTYRLLKRESYLIHRVESVLGPLFARGGERLWKWNGSELVVLEVALNHWIS